jgi:hypothetical protein
MLLPLLNAPAARLLLTLFRLSSSAARQVGSLTACRMTAAAPNSSAWPDQPPNRLAGGCAPAFLEGALVPLPPPPPPAAGGARRIREGGVPW